MCGRAAPDGNGRNEQMHLIDQPGFDRLTGEVRSAD